MPLTNSQFSSIMAVYSERQRRNELEKAAKQEALYEKEPHLLELEQSIAHLTVQLTTAKINGQASKADALSRELKAARDERSSLLHFLGITPEDLEPSYDCPDCKDTGYIGREKCHCLKQACIDLVYKQSNLQEVLRRENFSHFSFDFYSNDITDKNSNCTPYDSAKLAYDTARDFIADFDESFENLIFIGNTGVGKTFLSNCIAYELLETGHSVVYFSADKLFDKLVKSRFDRENDGPSEASQILDCDLLIIDDLGTEFASGKNSYATSQLFLCINERILRRKSTIISTNLSLQQIADTYTERISSRLSSDYKILRLIGNDIRIQKKLQG